jgi:phosphatidylserine/phosphatidylglycerophosphate/cardiolipin synthase-like enzyme
MPVDDPLAAAVRQAATELPIGQLHKLADAFGKHEGPTAVARHGIVNTVPTALFRHHAAALCEAWASGSPSLPGGGVALAVRAAAEAVGDVRGETQLSVVWTGPASYEVPVRATGAVLAEVIEGAAKTLVVVSFAAYKVAAVVEALRAAAARGVDVRLVLESVVESKGKLSHDAKQAFDALGNAVSFYVWPAELRVSQGGGHAAMHVKCAVADRHTAFVTSANLTGAAMTDNMELGLVVRGGDVPRRIADHFGTLMSDGVLCTLERSIV